MRLGNIKRMALPTPLNGGRSLASGKKAIMEKTTRSQDKELREMHRVLKSIASKLDRANFYEYMLYVQDKKRIMRVSFLSGIMRGLGGAIGFTLLGAVVVYILQRIADSHLPGIAEFIAELINIVNSKRS